MTLLGIMAVAFGFGLATAVSPCPLATNVAAISFLGRNVSNPRRVLTSALLYTLGRTLVYVALGAVALWAFHAATGGQGSVKEFVEGSSEARNIQHYVNLALGPVLLLMGMILSGLLELNISIGVGGTRLQERVAAGGAIWALPLGMLFALAFCPPSIMWFTAALAAAHDAASPILPPLAYGIGTAVPVIGFALLIAFAGQYVGKAFNRLTQIERWFRLAAGTVFILAGIYTILTHIYGLKLMPGT